jgi:mannose-6-phosphate isomerase
MQVPHRAMVQARQIYVFAHAAQLGWFVEGARLAEAAMASLLRDFCARSGGQASLTFSTSSDCGIISPIRGAYAHAFVLFALAGWLNGEPQLLSLQTK